MDETKPGPIYNVGDRVRIRLYPDSKGRIAEYRGPLGPKGAHIYSILFRRKPSRVYIEMREDQIEPLPAKSET